MKRIAMFLMIIGIPTVLLAQGEEAASKHAREGFWISVGLGGGSLGLGGDVSDVDRETGLSGYLRMGGTLSRKVLLGGESNGWTKEIDGIRTTVGFLAPVILWYPSETVDFYLKGGLGFLFIDEEDGGFGKVTGSGFGVSIGVGYEARVGRMFSIVIFLNGIASTGVEAKLAGTGTGVDVDPDFGQLGVGVTWH